jgi:hypothetical protein
MGTDLPLTGSLLSFFFRFLFLTSSDFENHFRRILQFYISDREKRKTESGGFDFADNLRRLPFLWFGCSVPVPKRCLPMP